MDFIKNAAGSLGGNQSEGQQQAQGQQQQSEGSGGGFLGGIGNELNSAAGGGRESEKNEDYLDKGKMNRSISLAPHSFLSTLGPSGSLPFFVLRLAVGVDLVQERVLGQGPQDNESAVEQAKDEQISDFIRGKYKSTTGSDIPIKDKETRLG